MPTGRDERGRPIHRREAQRARATIHAVAPWAASMIGRLSLLPVAGLIAALLCTSALASTARAAADPELADPESRTAQPEDAEPADASGDASGEEGVAAAEAAGETKPPPRRAPPPPPLGTRFPEPLEGQKLRLRYQFTREKLQGLMRADRDTSPGFVRNDLFVDYLETPRALDRTTHLIEVAYAPHPRTTLVVQVPLLQRELETLEGDTAYRRHDQTEGVGDVLLALVVPFIRKGRESSHVHLAFDFPSGDIREEDRDGRRLPYDLQLGNGTVDFEWGWTYRGEHDWLSWGGQAVGRHPLEENGLDYREGSRFEASLWSGVRLFAGLSTSLRVQWQKQNNLSGRDRGLDPIVSPAENGKARGGTRFLLGPGLSWDLPGFAAGQRLALEFSVPVHQDLDGPQLEQDWTLTSGWQWAF